MFLPVISSRGVIFHHRCPLRFAMSSPDRRSASYILLNLNSPCKSTVTQLIARPIRCYAGPLVKLLRGRLIRGKLGIFQSKVM